MRIVFTLCSNNYLALAKTLADSYLENNPLNKFYIGLVDIKIEQIDYNWPDIEVLEIHKINIPDIDNLINRYNIIELNTAVKPFFIKYLFELNKDCEKVIYLDPDIFVFNNFDAIEQELSDNNILITPHITSPYGVDKLLLNETTFLNYGIFNLGFIALNRSDETFRFLEWWSERLRYYCYINFSEGLFTDQLWINYAPVFFSKVKISYHLGLNLAYWNLHERVITHKRDNELLVNDLYPLIFMHISGFNPNNPTTINGIQTRIDSSKRKDIMPLYGLYSEKVLKNNYNKYKAYQCYYVDFYNKYQQALVREMINVDFKNKFIYFIYKATPNFVIKIFTLIVNKIHLYKKL